jgi:hypothetical protein
MENGKTTPTPEQQAAADAMQDMPIVLNLTLRKVNFILNIMAQLPYEKAFQPIADIQQMVVGQVQAAQQAAQAMQAAQSPEATPESTPEAPTATVDAPVEVPVDVPVEA